MISLKDIDSSKLLLQICSTCKEELPIDLFTLRKNKKGDHYVGTVCKKCTSLYKKQYALKHQSEISEYKSSWYLRERDRYLIKFKERYSNNIVDERQKHKIYRDSHKEESALLMKAYYDANKDELKEKNKIYYVENKESILNQKKEYIQSNLSAQIGHNLRGRIWSALKGGHKGDRLFGLMGCSFDFFKQYMENLFKDNMSWNNYGKNGWHIDHIRPCASFNLTDPEEQKKCFHYTNLQPMWSSENISKGSRYNGIIHRLKK